MNGYYWPSKRVLKKVESQGKVSEKSGNFDTYIEWQPCLEPAHKDPCNLDPLKLCRKTGVYKVKHFLIAALKHTLCVLVIEAVLKSTNNPCFQLK